jgi:O-antigen ligase
VIAALIAIPFLFPLTAGPSVSMWQLLVSWACIAGLVLSLRGGRARPGTALLAWLALVAAAIAVLHGDVFGFWAPACVALLATGLAALAGARMAGKRAREAAFAWGLLFAGLVSTALGLLQYFGLAESLVPWTSAPDLGQAFGNLRQRNQFATLLSMALVALLWLHAMTESGRRRLAWGASAFLLTMGQAASNSRTGLLQFVFIAAVAALIARRERRSQLPISNCRSGAMRLPPPWMLLALIPLYALAAWALPHLAGGAVVGMFDRLREGESPGHDRLLLWGNVLDLIARHPWIGWGWGELKFAHYSTLYAGPRFVDILDNAHDLPLHLAVELGVPAALAICAGFGWLVLAARPWRETDPARLMAWGVLGAVVLHSLLEYPLWFGPFQLVFGLCLGLLWPAPAQPASSGSPAGLGTLAQQRFGMRLRSGRAAHRGTFAQQRFGIRLRSALPGALAVALLATVVYAGWDYTRVSQVFIERDQRLPAFRDQPLAQAQGSWLFGETVDFAALALTPVNAANARDIHALAGRVLHFSPEPGVIEKLIESARLLGDEDEAAAQAARFRASFPGAYARWAGRKAAQDGSAPRARLQSSAPSGGPATKLPDLPPCFSSRRTPVIVMLRSTALHMS